jgi:cholesterol oxidase
MRTGPACKGSRGSTRVGRVVRRDQFDAVVIGSGFGGSIVALRLASAGNRVLVLERGQPYPPGSFARSPNGMRRNFWEPENELFGMFDMWSFQHVDAVVASGLGGGSLIYANVMIRKDESTFVKEDVAAKGYENWPVTRGDLDVHYDRVEALQEPEQYPFELGAPYSTTGKTKAMKDAAAALGLTADLPKLAVKFAVTPGRPVPGQEIPRGSNNLHGTPRSTCRLCGECDVGCNYGSKNTLDLTALSLALQTRNAVIRTCCEVHTVTPVPPGDGTRGYEVAYRQYTAANDSHPAHLLDSSPQEQRVVHASKVVIAAGSLGTTHLLLRNRATLPGLSRALGSRFSANGDYFAWIRDARDRNGEWRDLDPERGPVITASIHVDEQSSRSGRGYYVQDAGAPVLANWLWQGLELPQDLLGARKRIFRRFRDQLFGKRDTHVSGLLASMFGDAHDSAAMMPLLGMGRDIPGGRLYIDEGRLELSWSPKASKDYERAVRGTFEDLARALNGKLTKDGMEWMKRSITAHPVGGCPMSEDARLGVVDAWGQVHGYTGLWIADGSVLPGPVGANPSFTIAALADRFSDRMTGRT